MRLHGYAYFYCSPEFADERIPTLREALDLCEELDLLLFLELQSGNTDDVNTPPSGRWFKHPSDHNSSEAVHSRLL